MSLTISPASDTDFDAIWLIFQTIIRQGDSYIYPESTTKEQAYDILAKDAAVYVAKINNEVAGFYVIRQNRVGRGSHICNAAYMVHPNFQGHGLGRKLGEHSLKEAKNLGYRAMQFNIVVSTNTRAVALWRSLGFDIIGTIPEGFNHKEKGLVDIYIMHRVL